MERYSYRRERTKTVSHPSFSSSLLDSIYRSIDQPEEEEVVVQRETMRKKQQMNEKMGDFQRLQMIEEWKVGGRRRSLADFVPKVKDNNTEVLFSNSSWSSSDSSSGCWFSASEVEESVFGNSTNKSSSSSCYGVPRPKPIKTSVSDMDLSTISYPKGSIQLEKPKHEDGSGRGGGFEKKMSRALKIYGDLKKSKQPISPGGKLASFLNSLFTSGHAKKAKTEANSNRKMSKSTNASTCSSASSFSRSCLSKTPASSSRDGKSSNGTKRSVRFYPVSVIVDEDCQPCGHKNLYDDKKTTLVKDYYKDNRCSANQELKNHVMATKNRRVEETAEDLLRSYQKRVDLEHDFRSKNHVKNQVFIDDEDDEDDVASCASSDLFELDNLSAIGMERYREELPVYETTHLDTNRAIAKGMIIM